MEDSEIVDLYWMRSDQAISETEEKYGTYCRSVALHITGNEQDAEECVNDTWLAAWNSMPDKRPSRLGSYLGCLARHLAIDRFRAARCGKRGGGETELVLDEFAEILPSEGDPAEILEVKELGAAIQKFVNTLGKFERMIFLGRYWFLLTVPEIAERNHISESRTKSMLFRLRRRLKQELEREGLL